MIQPSVSDIRNSKQFQLLVELQHKNLIAFVNEYYWIRKKEFQWKALK